MSSTLLKKEEVKSPVVFLFGAVYVFAVVLALLSDPSQALVYVGLSLGILLLVWLVLGITEKNPIEDIQVRKPGLELAFGCLVYLIIEFTPWPNLGGKWGLGTILKKEILLFALPCVFLRLRKNSFSSVGLSLFNWQQHLRVAGITLVCLAIPSVFFVSDTARLILGGKLNPAQAVPASLVYFIYNVAMAGFPEEFFWRAFVQTRLSQVLKSRLGGILVASLLFGLIHIPDVTRGYSGMTLSEAFCSALFLQGFTGLIFGVLWERTRNLIPGTIVHSGINTFNNVGPAVSLVFR